MTPRWTHHPVVEFLAIVLLAGAAAASTTLARDHAHLVARWSLATLAAVFVAAGLRLSIDRRAIDPPASRSVALLLAACIPLSVHATADRPAADIALMMAALTIVGTQARNGRYRILAVAVFLAGCSLELTCLVLAPLVLPGRWRSRVLPIAVLTPLVLVWWPHAPSTTCRLANFVYERHADLGLLMPLILLGVVGGALLPPDSSGEQPRRGMAMASLAALSAILFGVALDPRIAGLGLFWCAPIGLRSLIDLMTAERFGLLSRNMGIAIALLGCALLLPAWQALRDGIVLLATLQ